MIEIFLKFLIRFFQIGRQNHNAKNSSNEIDRNSNPKIQLITKIDVTSSKGKMSYHISNIKDFVKSLVYH